MEITRNKKNGALYAGRFLPKKSILIGTVSDENPYRYGALVQLRYGTFVQMNAGCLRYLDQRVVRKLLQNRNTKTIKGESMCRSTNPKKQTVH